MNQHTPTRVLAFDDQGDTACLYRKILQEGPNAKDFDLCLVTSGAAFKALYAQFQPQIALLDVNLPDMSGLELCEYIRTNPNPHSYTGILFVSTATSPVFAIKCLSIGADDFCPIHLSELEIRARIYRINRVRRLADSLASANHHLRESNAKLAQITITDELTQLYNMRFFEKRLQEEFARATRYTKPLSLIMLDIDHFKEVNDRFDHLTGSYVLHKIGAVIKQSIRTIDIPARFGGDEFVVLLPETSLPGARSLARRIAASLVNTTFHGDTFCLHVSASFGISTLYGIAEPPQSATELIRVADRFLYRAKHQGRSQIVDFLETYVQPVFHHPKEDLHLSL